MKKIIALFLSLIIVLSFGAVVNAEDTTTKIGNLSVVIPEGMTLEEESYQEIVYADKESRRGVAYLYIEDTYEDSAIENIKDLDEQEVKGFLSFVSSAEIIKEGIKEYDESVENVKITSTDSKYININGIDVYEYFLAYTSNVQNGTITMGMFVHDKDMYMYVYERVQRDTEGEKLLRESIEKMSFEEQTPTQTPIKIKIDGEYITPDSDPTIVNDRTLVPIRAVAEKLGYNVSWVPETRTAVITNGKVILRVTIDSPEMVKETKEEVDFVPEFYTQEKVALDVSATIINDRTYLPLRAIGEALGCNVDWEASSRTVIISSK